MAEPERAAPAIAWTLAGVLLLELAGAAASSNWTWGLATLRFWGAGAAAALTLLAAAGFVPPVARVLGRVLARVGRWLQAPGIADALVALTVALLLFTLRDPVRFVGDSSMRVQAIRFAKPPTTLFPQAAPLDLLVNFHLPRMLVRAGWTPLLALQAVGACVGAAFVLAILWLLRALDAKGAPLAAGLWIAVLGSPLVHFAGNDKFGPLILGGALAALGAARLSRGRGGAFWLAAGAAIVVLSHRSGMVLLPALGWVGARAWRSEPDPRRRARLLAAATLPLAALAFTLPRTLPLLATLDLRVHLPGGAVERSLESPDAPGPLVHVTDFLNGLFLTAPLWVAGAAAALVLRRRRAGREVARFGLAGPLLLSLGLQAALLIAVGATRGSGRDWDVVAPAGALAALAAGAALARVQPHARALPAAAAVTLVAALAIARWGVHAREPMGLARAESLLHDRPAWSPSARAQAHDFLGLRAVARGDWSVAEVEFDRAIASAPNPRYFLELGAARLATGRPTAAVAPLRRAVTLSPQMTEAWDQLAAAMAAVGDTAGALGVLDSALARAPGNAALAARRATLSGRSAR